MTEREVKNKSLEQTPDNEISTGSDINTRIESLLGYDPNLPEDKEKHPFQKSSTLWQRETHSKSGEHVFISHNDHSESKHYVPAQFFIQVYGPEHSRVTPQIIDDIRWTANDDITVLAPEKLERIKQVLGYFSQPEDS